MDTTALATKSKTFAEERSHRDAEASNDTGRATAQAAILINGGAATAMLAYLAKPDGPSHAVLAVIAFCLSLYGFGAVFGAIMLHSRMLSLDMYSVRWRRVADGADEGQIKYAQDKAYGHLRASWRWFNASMALFLISSICLAVALGIAPSFNSQPALNNETIEINYEH